MSLLAANADGEAAAEVVNSDDGDDDDDEIVKGDGEAGG